MCSRRFDVKRKQRTETAKGEQSIAEAAIQAGLIAGITLGLVWGIELNIVGDLIAYPLDSLIFIGYLSAFTICGSLLFIGLMALPCFLLSRRKSDNRRSIIFCIRFVAFMSVVFPQALLIFIEISRPISLNSTKFLFAFLVIFCLSFLLTRWVNRYSFCSRRFLRKPLLWIPGYLAALMVILFVLSAATSHTPVNKEPLPSVTPENKVLFLGVDAAWWESLMPLVKAGKCPNLARLIDEGASGDLPSLVSVYNPMKNTITSGIKSAAVWNSILTGKSPYKHGIKDFIYTEIPGISHPFRYPLLPSFTPYRNEVKIALNLQLRPFNRFYRKTKAIWSILSDMNLEVGALGWWTTWPAEKVNGDFLSDRFDDPLLPDRWFPEDLVSPEQIDTLLSRYKQPQLQDIRYFTPYEYEPEYREKFEENSRQYRINELLYNLFKSYYQDRFRSRLGLKLISEHDYWFFSVYFYGLDTAGHAFMRYKYPDLFPDIRTGELEAFAEIIDRYHVWIDREIGKYMAQIDSNTTIVLCSDHGIGPWTGMRMTQNGVALSGSHRENGVVILWGPPIRKGVKIQPDNLLDILPTVLYILGLPVADDMDGHVIVDAIEPAVLQRRPIAFVKTYETEKFRLTRGSPARRYDEEMINRLRALGYIK